MGLNRDFFSTTQFEETIFRAGFYQNVDITYEQIWFANPAELPSFPVCGEFVTKGWHIWITHIKKKIEKEESFS